MPDLSARLIHQSRTPNTPPIIPPSMGSPRPDQLQGSPYEQLIELAGRVCYDSLGKGRSSPDYHQHIVDSQHFSLYEHCWLFFRVDAPTSHALIQQHGLLPTGLFFNNRPGCFTFIRHPTSAFSIPETVVAINYRAIVEFDYITTQYAQLGVLAQHPLTISVSHAIRHAMLDMLKADAPDLPIPQCEHHDNTLPPTLFTRIAPAEVPLFLNFHTFHITCSRRASLELVRHHRYLTGFSQRSTRYCDEDPYSNVEHPLISRLLADNNNSLSTSINHARTQITTVYEEIVERGTNYLYATCPSLGKTDARKQARAAAASILPHDLSTEIIFTVPSFVLISLLQRRWSPHADAEIRQLAALLAAAIKGTPLHTSYFGEHSNFAIEPSPDGLGTCLTVTDIDPTAAIFNLPDDEETPSND